MIEQKILDYASSMLDVDVYMEFPAKPPLRFVVLKRTGEGRENHLEESLLIADSYAESLLEAAKLNAKVKTVLDELTVLDDISSAELSADYPAIDTENKKHRYQAVYKLNHY